MISLRKVTKTISQIYHKTCLVLGVICETLWWEKYLNPKQFNKIMHNIYKYKWIARTCIMFCLRMKELWSVGKTDRELMDDYLINKDRLSI